MIKEKPRRSKESMGTTKLKRNSGRSKGH
uniref:Uncharacterized protein n=1 Tax=Arundo donax TaxID=35708 RepID=A0A0A9BAC0_ARUDO